MTRLAFRLPVTLFAAIALPLAVVALAGAQPAEPAPAPAGLATQLQQLLGSPALKGAKVGAVVARVDSGALLFAHQPDQLLNPASNIKLLTTAAALDQLGPAFRFATRVYAGGPLVDGVLQGPLYVKGFGDPLLTDERLWLLVKDLDMRGVRRVEGDLVLDGSYFDAPAVPPGFPVTSSSRAFHAPISALSLNFNTVSIHSYPGARVGEPARVVLDPTVPLFRLDSQLVTGPAGGKRKISAHVLPAGDDGRQRVTVRGSIPFGHSGVRLWRKVEQPLPYLGQVMVAEMKRRGMTVTGAARAGRVPAGATALHEIEGRALASVVRALNKLSSNFIAEQLLLTLGAERFGEPGTYASGLQAISESVTGLGVPATAFRQGNGSGYGDVNAVSPRALVDLLVAMQRRQELAPDYAASLGIAGVDGTLKSRMRSGPARGRLRAKTGLLSNAIALSGYVAAADGTLLAFSLLVNDYRTGPAQVWQAGDQFGELLAASRPSEQGGAR